MCTWKSRKILWDMINTLFPALSMSNLLFLLSLSTHNYTPWPLVPFFQIFLKNIEPKSPHNTFRACRVHFFRQPFSKKLYIQSRLVFLSRCATHARSTRYATLDMIINLRYARRGINCGWQEKHAILIFRLLLRMRRMYVASVRLAFH